MSTREQFESSGAGTQCGLCQHSVDVPGMDHIVCLAFLAVRHSAKDVFCSEFEGKLQATSSATD